MEKNALLDYPSLYGGACSLLDQFFLLLTIPGPCISCIKLLPQSPVAKAHLKFQDAGMQPLIFVVFIIMVIPNCFGYANIWKELEWGWALSFMQMG